MISQAYTLPMKLDLKVLRKLQEKRYKRKAEELREMESEIAQKQRMAELRSKYADAAG